MPIPRLFALLLAGGRRARGAALRFWGSTALALLFLFPLTFGLGYRLPSLEERLGGRLLNRTSRHLALTEFGTTIAERAGDIYRQAEAAENVARELSVKPRGLIRLAVTLATQPFSKTSRALTISSWPPKTMVPRA